MLLDVSFDSVIPATGSLEQEEGHGLGDDWWTSPERLSFFDGGGSPAESSNGREEKPPFDDLGEQEDPPTVPTAVSFVEVNSI